MKLDNDVEHIITSKKNKDGNIVTKVNPGKGYCEGLDTLLKLTDNGNGYTAKFPSYSSVYPDMYLNIDYAQAEYLFLAFKHIFEGKNDA